MGAVTCGVVRSLCWTRLGACWGQPCRMARACVLARGRLGSPVGGAAACLPAGRDALAGPGRGRGVGLPKLSGTCGARVSRPRLGSVGHSLVCGSRTTRPCRHSTVAFTQVHGDGGCRRWVAVWLVPVELLHSQQLSHQQPGDRFMLSGLPMPRACTHSPGSHCSPMSRSDERLSQTQRPRPPRSDVAHRRVTHCHAGQSPWPCGDPHRKTGTCWVLCHQKDCRTCSPSPKGLSHLQPPTKRTVGSAAPHPRCPPVFHVAGMHVEQPGGEETA